MKAGLLCLVLFAGCVQEHECRDGTVLVTLKFLDGSQVVDGVAMKYQLDYGPFVDVAPPISRPAGRNQGTLELNVQNYGKRLKLTLQYAPTKGGMVVGDWQTVTADLTADCVAGELEIKAWPQDGGVGVAGKVLIPGDALAGAISG